MASGAAMEPQAWTEQGGSSPHPNRLLTPTDGNQGRLLGPALLHLTHLHAQPTHIQHGRVPPEFHEVLTEFALIFIQDICIAGERVSLASRAVAAPCTLWAGPHQT